MSWSNSLAPPARTLKEMRAKAEALMTRCVQEDAETSEELGRSLAEDVLELAAA